MMKIVPVHRHSFMVYRRLTEKRVFIHGVS